MIIATDDAHVYVDILVAVIARWRSTVAQSRPRSRCRQDAVKQQSFMPFFHTHARPFDRLIRDRQQCNANGADDEACDACI
jgi:hypothetical protein